MLRPRAIEGPYTNMVKKSKQILAQSGPPSLRNSTNRTDSSYGIDQMTLKHEHPGDPLHTPTSGWQVLGADTEQVDNVEVFADMDHDLGLATERIQVCPVLLALDHLDSHRGGRLAGHHALGTPAVHATELTATEQLLCSHHNKFKTLLVSNLIRIVS